MCAAQAANMNVIRYVGASHFKTIVTQMPDGINIDRFNSDSFKSVCTIEHWQQLLEQVPSLISSCNIER